MHAASPSGLPAVAIGRYRLAARAGAGASGEVFLATDATSARPIALKLHRPGSGDAGREWQRRFETEARVLGALRHPDIVEVIDAGHWHGRPWIAMEWVAGHDLGRYVPAARRLPDVLALEVAERLARALAHAHRAGVVHRDLKPGNVRVHLAARRLKLTDFGLARAIDAEETRTGVVVGSPAYMAPEQLAGAAASASGDLYALGVVLFELLTGRRPHESSSLGELLRQVAVEAAPDLREWRPELPAALAAELARLLSKRPEARHPSAEALAEALGRARLHVEAASVPQ
jgi:serine/threonine-protein kinase